MPETASVPNFRTLGTPPLTVNRRLFDRFVRRAHQIERVKRGLSRDTSRFLRDSVFSGLGETMTTMLNRIRGRRDVAAIHGTKAFKSLAKRTQGTLNAGYGRAMNDLAKQLRFLALEESRFVVNVLGQDIPFDYSAKVPALRDFRKAIRNQPFQGRTLQQWFRGMATNTATQTMSQVNLGLLEGETTAKIVRRMTGRKGVFDKALGEAEKIAETAAGHAGNSGAGLAIQANSEVVGWEVWTAIFDSATCAICGGLDGNKYRVGEGPIPIDSTHPVCRCDRIPQLKSAKELGLKEGDLTPIQRRAMDGKVSEKTTYRGWFRKQSAAFQDNVLGKTKGRLYRQGKVTINSVVDADLKPLSLDRLRAREDLTLDDIKIVRRPRRRPRPPRAPSVPRPREIPKMQPLGPNERAMVFHGRAKHIRLTDRQLEAEQSAKWLRANPSARSGATHDQRRDWMNWEWVHGSKRKTSVMMKQAAIKEFNLRGVAYSGGKQYRINAGEVRAMRKDVRRMREQTLAHFRSRNIKTVRMYRGLKGEVTQPGALSSWTTDRTKAARFDGHKVLERDIPVEKIFFGRRSEGWVNGIWGEQSEYIVMDWL